MPAGWQLARAQARGEAGGKVGSDQELKHCKHCARDRRIEDFYPSRFDRCKECLYAASRAYRAKDPEHWRKYTRKYEAAKRAARLAAIGDRNCTVCGGPIPDDKAIGVAKYCSYRCKLDAAEIRRRAEVLKSREGRLCARCGEPIPITRTLKSVVCSARCRDALNEKQRYKDKCRELSHYAIKVGRLTKQSCEVCGSPDVEIHHVDYFEPLNVRFLCFEHHRVIGHGQTVKQKETAASGI